MQTVSEPTLPACGAYAQCQRVQPRQKLLEPRDAVEVLVAEVDGVELLPVWLKGLYVSDDLHEAVVGNAERTFGQEGGVASRELGG